MQHYAGLDVSVKETSVCIVDASGRTCQEKKVVSHPEDLVTILSNPALSLERIGLEAGPMSQWLFDGLAKAGLPVFCIETRHTKGFLKASRTNKSDRNDARGIAHMMRVGLFKNVHVKTLTSQKRRALLTARSLLQEKAIALENDMGGLLRDFGLKVGVVSAGTFEEMHRMCVDGTENSGGRGKRPAPCPCKKVGSHEIRESIFKVPPRGGRRPSRTMVM
ncbi:transposase [Sinorhizobium sp. KGO-5]|nr:transposase [Sinorhizobium sp. KGO-5]